MTSEPTERKPMSGAQYPDTPFGRLRAYSDAWRNFLPGTDVIAEGPEPDDPRLSRADLDAALAEIVQLERRIDNERFEADIAVRELRAAATARAEQAEAALAAVLDLHRESNVQDGDWKHGPHWPCVVCHDGPWPCATRRAADATLRTALPHITDGITGDEADASATLDLTVDEIRSAVAERDRLRARLGKTHDEWGVEHPVHDRRTWKTERDAWDYSAHLREFDPGWRVVSRLAGEWQNATAPGALERAAEEQGVRPGDWLGALVASEDDPLTDEEFAEWSAWQRKAPCCSEDAAEQGDGEGGGDA